MTGTGTLASTGANYSAIVIPIGIMAILGAVVAVIVASYFRLQGHRADAVAMAPTASSPRTRWPTSRSCATSSTKLTEHVQAVEQLMREWADTRPARGQARPGHWPAARRRTGAAAGTRSAPADRNPLRLVFSASPVARGPATWPATSS